MVLSEYLAWSKSVLVLSTMARGIAFSGPAVAIDAVISTQTTREKGSPQRKRVSSEEWSGASAAV